MTSRTLAGIIAAVPSPVDARGEPDVVRFLAHARWALANGCDGLNVLGTTGEANSLSAAQRKTIMAAAASEFDTARLMVGTGTADIATAIDLTRYAHELGYSGALVLPPWYYKKVTDDGLFAWYERLIGATADTPVPVYLYNFPQMTGLKLSLGLVERLKASFPRRITGIKDSSGDFDNSAALTRIADFDVFPGNEVALTKSDGNGYAGCISATVNVIAPLAARFWADRENGELGARMTAARNAISAYPTVPAVKYLVGRIQGDADFERVLPPHLPLDKSDKAALADLQLD
jgi:4-hydroxy-tetrahydrodipicolinate synthase